MPWISYRSRTNALSWHNFARSPNELCARLSRVITRNERVMNNRRLTEVELLQLRLRVPIDSIRVTFWLVRRTRCSRGITINCSPMCLSPSCIYSIPASLALRISSISAFACVRTCVISQSTNSKSLVPGARLIPASELILSFVPIILSVIYDQYSAMTWPRSVESYNNRFDTINAWFLPPFLWLRTCFYFRMHEMCTCTIRDRFVEAVSLLFIS